MRPSVIGERARGPELMERRGLDPEALGRALEDLALVNRRLGGYGPLRRSLAGLVSERKAVTVLDVGAGDAATLLHLRGWAPPSWQFVGVDHHPRIVQMARSRTRGVGRIAVARSDGLRMPFRDDSFDVALCNLTLHHFGGGDAVDLLREMARVASMRVVVNDLHRHLLNYLSALLLAGTLWRNSPVTRHDGPLSVRRSFTPEELERIGAAAGLREIRVRRHAPFRLVLEGRPPGEREETERSRSGQPDAGARAGGGARNRPGRRT